ncbi:MAG: hypothetical protein ACI9ON_002321 [Limisphaerales bacterium]|jgi:hypothetical protein
MNSQAVSEIVSSWLDTFVVGMNLCPFAGKEITQGRVRLAVTDANDEDALLAALQDEILALAQDPATETTLLIHPLVLNDFLDYNDFLSVSDSLLQDMNAEGEFQIASFHPHYQFAETEFDDAENYTNRSPFPLLHILRERSVSHAVETHPNVNEIPANNIAQLNKLGTEHLKTLWSTLGGKSHEQNV